ncbi:Yls3 [Thalictrum thalictroides]|uniref:Yls3 n=1 Tax=Thalictrum thalictroides TaxID=46969 RepID=A0A7J6WK58_THATH|nr:Yls3 [Thalictrum thalictroides]
MKEVLVKSKKCLCLLVKNRNDPTLGLKINATLALNLPSVCKSDVTIADCPALLHLPPNSPDAKVFQQFEKSLHKSPPTPPDAHSANSTSTVGSGAQGNKCLELKIISQVSLWLSALLLLIG